MTIEKTGTSWDSVADSVMLALNSRKPPVEVGPISAGADTLTTFREPVNVQINDKNMAELVFEKNGSVDIVNYTKVQRNKAH